MSTTLPNSKHTGAASRQRKIENPRVLRRSSRRTTITLSPVSQEIVERFKAARGTSTSAAIDRIIQSIEPKPSRLKEVNGFLVLDTPSNHATAHFTLDDLKELEDGIDREYVGRTIPRKDKRPHKESASGRRR